MSSKILDIHLSNILDKMRILYIILFLTTVNVALGQTLQGVVYDETTKEPLADVTVYLDGTAIYTTTNKKGEFKLNVNRIINTQLIINHIGYELVTIANPFEEIPNKFYLKEKPNILDEAIIVTDKFTREEKLKAFREQFLGKTKAGKLCRILNEDEIKFTYNLKDNSFSAKCNTPVYLKYKVYFNLLNFDVIYNSYTLDYDKAKQSSYYGTSQFIDLKPEDKRTEKRRAEIYIQSSSNFFKNLVNHSLKENDLQVFNKGFMVDPYYYFTIKDTLSQKMLVINPETNIDRLVFGLKVPVYGKLSVLYKKKAQSEIIWLAPSVLIDSYGNYSPVKNIYFMGQFGLQRLGNMLPLDYTLSNK